VSYLACGETFENLEAAAYPIVTITAFGDPTSDKLAEQALQRVTHLGMVRCGSSQRAAVAPNDVDAIFLDNFREPTQLVQE
jgi:hypothetical protein